MFKAINTTDESDIIILDPKWEGAAETLRILDRRDVIVCQECRQPVRLRAGEVRRPHFAHKHQVNCTLESESPEILNARAVLYEKLRTVFGTAVTVEKKLDTERLCRFVDCWVENGERHIAYWLIDKALRPQVRETIRTAFDDAGVTVIWIFTRKMLRESEIGVNLSTTEREFMQQTPYDAAYSGIPGVGETLHYLDADTRVLTTFRALLPACGPLYRGNRMSHPFADVHVSTDTGTFIHPFEAEQIAQWQERRADEERRAAQRARLATSIQPIQRDLIANLRSDLFPDPQSANPSIIDTPVLSVMEREGVCIYCGRRTTDWWSYDGKTGTCKCNACSDPRRTATAQFQVPLALNAFGTLIQPGHADKACQYRCPACHEPVILRKDDVKMAYFAHRASNVCGEERIIRQAAMLLIQQAIRAWKKNMVGAPTILRSCATCENIIETSLSRHITDAVLEHQLTDGSVVDVALLCGESVIAAALIRVNHAIEERVMRRLPVPCIELAGEAVIVNPLTWEPLAHSMRAFTCPKCQAHSSDTGIASEPDHDTCPETEG